MSTGNAVILANAGTSAPDIRMDVPQVPVQAPADCHSPPPFPLSDDVENPKTAQPVVADA